MRGLPLMPLRRLLGLLGLLLLGLLWLLIGLMPLGLPRPMVLLRGLSLELPLGPVRLMVLLLGLLPVLPVMPLVGVLRLLMLLGIPNVSGSSTDCGTGQLQQVRKTTSHIPPQRLETITDADIQAAVRDWMGRVPEPQKSDLQYRMPQWRELGESQ